MSSEPLSFKQLFCSQVGCSPEQFEAAALKRCLHPPWGMLSPVILIFRPGAIKTDRLIIRQLGEVSDPRAFYADAQTLRSEYGRFKDFGFARRILRFRLSGERLLAVSSGFWSGEGLSR